MLDFLLLFFVHVFSKVSNAKAIHSNAGSFCHKCSEPLNVHQSNLALLVCILHVLLFLMLSVADCFVHESVLQFFLGQHREVSFVVWCKMIRLVERVNDLKQITYSFSLNYRPA